MRVDRQYVELDDNSLALDSPKSAAGVRTVHIPPHLLPELRAHIEEYAGPSLIFTTRKGDPLSRGGFRTTWVPAVTVVRVPQNPAPPNVLQSCRTISQLGSTQQTQGDSDLLKYVSDHR